MKTGGSVKQISSKEKNQGVECLAGVSKNLEREKKARSMRGRAEKGVCGLTKGDKVRRGKKKDQSGEKVKTQAGKTENQPRHWGQVSHYHGSLERIELKDNQT